MRGFGRGALDSLATLWILFGGIGLAMSLANLAGSEMPYPGWQWTVMVSVGLILGGVGILRRRRWARWIAAAGVAGGLFEAIAWLWWTWTPVLVATVIFHVYGGLVLAFTRFTPEPTSNGRAPHGSADGAQ